MTALCVALGSALGGVCRFWLSALLNGSAGFPWGTLTVNVLGSLAIGALSGWLAQASGNVAMTRAFTVTGFCGGFTTFSTLSNETFRMLEGGQFGLAAGYVGITGFAGIAAIWLGYFISRG